VREPDIVVCRGLPLDQPHLTEPPVLVVEVLSAASAYTDLMVKRDEYAPRGSSTTGW
jgi:Uma2 family endonuclease